MFSSLCVFLFICCSYDTRAQDNKIKFGKVTLEELKMDSYKGDSTISAVVLYDYGYSTPDSYIRHRRIKIFNKEGYKWANVEVPILSRNRLNSMKAITYNLEGSAIVETVLDNKLIYKEDFNSFLDVMKFAFSNVKEGSVIEFRYDISPEPSYIFLSDAEWNFQSLIPTVWSEFIFVQHAYVTYQNMIQGYNPIAVYDDSMSKTWRWVMKDIPAFNEEPFSASYQNYISKVKVSISAIQARMNLPIILSNDWADVRRNYWSMVFENDNVRSTRALKTICLELTSNATTKEEQALKIYNYIKSKLEWNGREMISMDNTIPKLLEKGRAASGEINLMLLAMLRYAGISAHPVLISTRDHGLVRIEMPDFRQFNRVVVLIDINGVKKLLDATDRFVSLDFLPEKCINGKALLLTANEFQWLDTKDFILRSQESVSGDFQLTASGDLAGTLMITRKGHEAGKSRREYAKDGKGKYITSSFSQYSVELRDSVLTHFDSTDVPLTENYTLKILDYATPTNNLIYLNPIAFSRVDQNPFHAEEREYPVDFIFTKEFSYSVGITIPEGYVVDGLPQPKLAVMPGNAGKFLYSVAQQGNTLRITSQVVISKSIFAQNEYPVLRAFYNTIVAKQSEPIVLKKL